MAVNIEKGALYSDGNVFVLPSEGEAYLLSDLPEIPESVEDKYHVVRKFDKLDTIANRYYKKFSSNPDKYYWAIAIANNIFMPLDLSDYIGVEIRIPHFFNINPNE